MSTTGVPAGPYRLVTVNTAPERAYRLIGRLVEALKDSYTIVHVANCESKYNKPIVSDHIHLGSDTAIAIETVESTVQQVQPDLLVRR